MVMMMIMMDDDGHDDDDNDDDVAWHTVDAMLKHGILYFMNILLNEMFTD